ncbi:amino acid permease [Neobacillus massiliamazoniensis]|uniref:Lysine-specific permease n=1 Tax=Neobacillus massiliamazoniensis TaxID=1499688 RepID=A0A0U1NSQ8_9BACI|nr:amino acid permease [Neobacillus massiliamazoniensis]CRK80758.1 lysine-specific permease [Neobacillus massiliamazoniensis]
MENHTNDLKRGLKSRHITMLSIGGAIGTGLFLASGNVVSKAGALGAPIAYLVIGILVFFLMKGLGEMSTFMPIPGAYTTYSGLFVHPVFGFIVGWNLIINATLGLGAEIVGGSMILNQFFSSIPPIVFCIIISLLILGLNLIDVKSYGEAEYWFAGIKVAAIIVFLIVGVLMIFGVIGHQGFIGLSNWNSKSVFPNGFIGVILMMTGVIWSYLGVETVVTAAGETENPQKNVPKAINSIFFRILIFYVGSVAIIGLVVPYNNVSVLNNGYAGLLGMAGIPGAAVIMNIVILTSLASCANSVIYSLSRTLVALSKEGKAPKALGKVNKRGIPVNAVLLVLFLGQVSLITNFVSPDKVFVWLTSIAGFNGMLLWFGSFLSHYKFRKWLVAHGGDVEKLKFKMGIYPIPTIICLIVLVAIAIYTVVSPDTRFSFYIGTPLLVLYFIIGICLYKKGKLKEPNYKPFLDAHINETEIK